MREASAWSVHGGWCGGLLQIRPAGAWDAAGGVGSGKQLVLALVEYGQWASTWLRPWGLDVGLQPEDVDLAAPQGYCQLLVMPEWLLLEQGGSRRGGC